MAGDKAGNRTRWYRDAIKLAEDRYARFLATPPEEKMPWRICFRWTDAGPEDVEIVDYH